ncbi:MAG: hypothetical protein JNK12_01565 [Acidimicrobiales bacterium]|nr:hypothetical protein [Acidimicrobiales bacterium]
MAEVSGPSPVEPTGAATPEPALTRRSLLRGLGLATAGGVLGAAAVGRFDDGTSEGAAAAARAFVWDPGEGADEGALSSWEEVVDAVRAAPPGDKWIEVRQDVEVPSGSWDIDGAGFRGDRANGVGLAPHGNPVIVRFADGARLEHPGRLLAINDVVLCSESSEPVVVIDQEQSHYFADDAWVTSTDHPFFEVTAPAGTLVLFSFRTGSGLVHAATAGIGSTRVESIDHQGEAALIVAMASGNNIFDDDTVRGTSVVIAGISSAAGIRQPELPRTGFRHRGADSASAVVFSVAENVGYRPANPADWPEAPTDVAEALDLLAARVAALER